MKYRSFLPGFECSELSLGTLGLAGGYGMFDANESIGAMRSAADLGINLFDTADVYGRGLAEDLLGASLATERAVWIVTKIGRDWYNGNNEKNWDPQYLSFAVHQSLKRLKRPCLDVCLLHNPDLDTLQKGLVFSVMEGLKSRGDIRHWGVSITTAEEGIAASDCTDCEVIQLYANIAEPDLLNVLLPSIDSSRIGIMVRMPLGGGLLTGKYTIDHKFTENDYRLTRDESWRQKMIEFSNQSLGNKSSKDRVHIALEYILCNGKVSTVTCGMRNSHQVQENVSALYL